ncbi:hypothetical protein E2C01_046507 [Portunus trituberculatus]|uniref:Uncharacterized protein n=1 Tax=Portunus trituberculatus TaxID=210409 RepID=A0A5B7G174_PORTR|nr:hypothetical protein [Portunus trituberculatus]
MVSRENLFMDFIFHARGALEGHPHAFKTRTRPSTETGREMQAINTKSTTNKSITATNIRENTITFPATCHNHFFQAPAEDTRGDRSPR